MSFDKPLFAAINGMAGSSHLLDRIGIFFAKDAVFVFVLAYIVLWVLFRDERSKRGLIYGTFGMLLGLLTALVIGFFSYRARPFIAEPSLVHLLIKHANDTSFPSDHATGSFALALGLVWTRRRALGILGLLFALAVAWGRVFVGVHWPTDVLGAAAIGLLSTWLILAIRPVFEPLVQFFFRQDRALRAGANPERE